LKEIERALRAQPQKAGDSRRHSLLIVGFDEIRSP